MSFWKTIGNGFIAAAEALYESTPTGKVDVILKNMESGSISKDTALKEISYIMKDLVRSTEQFHRVANSSNNR